MVRLFGLSLLLFGMNVSVHSEVTQQIGKPNGTLQKAKTRSPHPSLAAFDVDPSLPNVLLIGDSISMGYTVPVRETLTGKANVFRPLTNCGPTTRGVELVDEWLADRNWDIIHFNFGLHDLKFMSPDGKNLADPTDPNNAPQVPIDQYAKNLRVIIQKLQATGATLIWRETSPVPAGAKGRVPGDARRYNSAAADVVSAFPQIQTDEFYAFCLKHADLQRPANVHYSPEGSRLLAAHVSSVILQALSEKTVAHPPS